jgi:hypothetical protein
LVIDGAAREERGWIRRAQTRRPKERFIAQKSRDAEGYFAAQADPFAGSEQKKRRLVPFRMTGFRIRAIEG